MAASIGRCLEIGLADDGLDGLDRRAGVVQHGGEAVAENMGRRAAQVDDAVDPLHAAASNKILLQEWIKNTDGQRVDNNRGIFHAVIEWH